MNLNPNHNTINLRVKGGNRIFNIEEILYFTTFDCHNAKIYLVSGDNYTVKQNLKSINCKLHKSKFIKCNASYLVNFMYIKEFNKRKVVLSNKKEIKISIKNSKIVNELISEYSGN